MRQLIRATACALTIGLAACTVAPSGLVVRVDSDFAVPAELAEIRAQVLADSGEVAQEASFSMADARLPLSFGVNHKNGNPDQPVTIVVEGRGPGGALLVTRRVVTTFVNRK